MQSRLGGGFGVFVMVVVVVVVTGFTRRRRMIGGVVSALARLQHSTSWPSTASLRLQRYTFMGTRVVGKQIVTGMF